MRLFDLNAFPSLNEGLAELCHGVPFKLAVTMPMIYNWIDLILWGQCFVSLWFKCSLARAQK